MLWVRRRPKVEVFLQPSVATPGVRLLTEAVLTGGNETPIDYVSLRLRAATRVGVGAGNTREVHEGLFFDREWRSEPLTLARGQRRFAAAFDIPPNAPPTYC